jgi:hypothetical protein
MCGLRHRSWPAIRVFQTPVSNNLLRSWGLHRSIDFNHFLKIGGAVRFTIISMRQQNAEDGG